MWLEQFGAVEDVVFFVFCAVVVLNVVLTIALFLFAACYTLRSPASSMDFYIGIGGLGLMACLLIVGFPTSEGNDEALKILCQIYPSLLLVSLSFFLGAMLLKASSIYDYYVSNRHKQEISEEWKPNFGMVILAVVDVLLILVWCIVHAMEIKKKPDTAPEKHIIKCFHPDGYDTYWKIGTSAYHGLLLLIAAIMVWPAVLKAKGTRSGADATFLCVIVYNVLATIVVALLVHFFYFEEKNDNTEWYTIMGGLTLWAVFITLLLLLGNRILHARRRMAEEEGYYHDVDDVKSSRHGGDLDNPTYDGSDKDYNY